MRKLDEEDKRIIKNISNVGEGEIKTVGSLITHLFKADKSAILVYDKVYLFTERGVDSSSMLILMAKILSLIDSLQNEGYLYLIPNKDYLFLQDGFDSSVTVNTHGDISCRRGTFERNASVMSIVLDNRPFVSIDLPEKIEEALKMIICNFVYPTAKLHELIKNDFTFGDELKYKTELKYTKRGLLISMIALCCSIVAPFYMTDYNNKHAISTIDSIQFNRIVQEIQNNNTMECKDCQMIIKNAKENTGTTLKQLDSIVSKSKSKENTGTTIKQVDSIVCK